MSRLSNEGLGSGIWSIIWGVVQGPKKGNNYSFNMVCPLPNSCWNMIAIVVMWGSGAFRRQLSGEEGVMTSHRNVLSLLRDWTGYPRNELQQSKAPFVLCLSHMCPLALPLSAMSWISVRLHQEAKMTLSDMPAPEPSVTINLDSSLDFPVSTQNRRRHGTHGKLGVLVSFFL